MNEDVFNQTVERLKQVNEVIGSLDEAIRAQAFAILKPYVTGRRGPAREKEDEQEHEGEEAAADSEWAEYDELIERHESDKDHENALLALAIYYDRHGRGPLDLSRVKAVAQEFHLEVPKRLDKFFLRAKRNDNEVLRKQSDGWKVTPSGESWLKSTYRVKRGKQPVASTSS